MASLGAYFAYANEPDAVVNWRLVTACAAFCYICYIIWRAFRPKDHEVPAVPQGPLVDMLFITCTDACISISPQRVAADVPLEAAAIAEWHRLLKARHAADALLAAASAPTRRVLRDAAELRMQGALESAKSWITTHAKPLARPTICVLGQTDVAPQLAAWIRAACRDIPALHAHAPRIVHVVV